MTSALARPGRAPRALLMLASPRSKLARALQFRTYVSLARSWDVCLGFKGRVWDHYVQACGVRELTRAVKGGPRTQRDVFFDCIFHGGRARGVAEPPPESRFAVVRMRTLTLTPPPTPTPGELKPGAGRTRTRM